MFSINLSGNLGGLLAGFAERDMELRKSAREESLGIAKDTLNYRAEKAMRKKQERDQELKDAVNVGRTLMNNYGFTMDQVGVLAGNGQLEEVAELYKKASTDPNFKGDLPSADAIVSIVDKKPENMTYEQYMRNIVIGEIDTTRAYERDIVQEDLPSEDAMFRAFGFDPNQQARKFTKEYLDQLGMTEQELNAEAFDAFVRTRPQGAVDLTGFRTGQKGARGDILFGKARTSIADTVANVMGLDSTFGPNGNFLNIKQRGKRANVAEVIIDGAAREIEELVAENGPEFYGEAVATIRAKLADARYRQQLYNGIMGREGDTPLPRDETIIGGNDDQIGLYTNEQRTVISGAENAGQIATILADISSRPGGSAEGERAKAILRMPNLSFAQKKKHILDGTKIEDINPTELRQEENPSNRFDRRGRVIIPEEALEADDQPMASASEIESARENLVARGVNINNKTDIKTALLALSKDAVQVAKDEFEGTPKEFMIMLGREYDMLAQQIMDSAQGGLV